MAKKNPKTEKTLTIGIDARPLVHPFNGNAQYLHKMLEELIHQRPNDRWILFSNKPIHKYFNDLLKRKQVQTIVSSEKIFSIGPLWVHFKLISELKKYRCSLFWATLAMLPLFYRKRSGIPALVNFHDLNAYSAPETMVYWNRLQHRLTDGHTLRNAHSILCLSKTTKNDIQKNFPKIPESSLKVIYPGCELPETKMKKPAQLAGIQRYMLSVGTIEPRKNQRTIIDAYLLAGKSSKNLPSLVLAGKKGWGDSELYDKLKSGELIKNNIIYLDSASMEELAYSYKHADFCLLPSLHEGFGLPVIEALQYGKISLLSDIPIFREICSECIFIPPSDTEMWSEKIIEMCGRKTKPSFPFNRSYWSWKKRAVLFTELIDSISKNQGISP